MYKRVIGLAMLLASSVPWIVLRLAHPDVTETRLVLTYWPLWLASLAVAVAGALLAGLADRRRR